MFIKFYISQADVARLTGELAKARTMVTSLKDKEESLKDMLVAEKKKQKKELVVSATNLNVIKNGTLSSMDKRPAALVSLKVFVFFYKYLKAHA